MTPEEGDEEASPSLETLYAAEAAELERALSRGREQLAGRQRALLAPQQRAGRTNVSPGTGQAPPAPRPRLLGSARWSVRFGGLAAAVLLVVLVGGLVAGLVLVRGHKLGTAGKVGTTTQPSASATSLPVRVNLYLLTEPDNVIVKVDSATGAVLWSYKWKKLTEGGSGFGPLLVGDGTVYFAGGEATSHQAISETLYAINAQTGALRWSQPAPTRLIYPMLTDTGVLYAQADGGIYALNASDGSTRWHTYLAAEVNNLALANGILYGTTVQDGTQSASRLFALRPDSGALLWQVALPASQAFGLAAAINGTLYLSSVEQQQATISNGALSARSSGQPVTSYVSAYSQAGKQLWQSQPFDGYFGNLVIADGRIFFTGTTSTETSAAFALSAQGGKLLWSYQADAGVFAYLVPIVVSGAVYLERGPRNSDSSVGWALLALSAQHGTRLWQKPLDAPSSVQVSPPLFGNGLLYVLIDEGYMSSLEAYNPGDGALISKKPLAGMFQPGGPGLSVGP
jgi:outer membrane protein assembly factor BamB